MQIVEIEDNSDDRLDIFRLNERQLNPRGKRRSPEESGLFIAEGDLVVERALNAGCLPAAILCSKRSLPWLLERPKIATNMQGSLAIYVADAATRSQVTGLGVPLDVLGVFHRPTPKSALEVLTTSDRVVVLEAVDNPTNVGAVVRSAAGLDWDAVVLDHTSSDPLSRRALRVSMGSAFAIDCVRPPANTHPMEILQQCGFTTIALTPSAHSLELGDNAHHAGLRGKKLALLLGSERAGLSESTINSCEICLRIPMSNGVDSLNVASAASIAMFALRRLR